MTKDQILQVWGDTLTCGETVIELRNVTGIDKLRRAKPYLPYSGIALALTAAAAALTGNASRILAGTSDNLLAVTAGVMLWLCGLALLALMRSKYALALHTSSGESPELLETRDVVLLDKLIEELRLRLGGAAAAPALKVDLRARTLTLGDHPRPDQAAPLPASALRGVERCES